jgi:type I restriction enzyme S subunit
MAKGPGVVTGRYGTIGEVFFIEDDFWPLNTTLYVKDFKGNDPRFISYFLRSINFHAYTDKAAVPGINRNDLHKAEIIFPSDIEEQRAIARILGALDDKIELNRRTNETLEAIARALFKSWFVDFDGIPAEDMQESELGLIPKGWRVAQVSELISFNPPEPLRKNTEAPYLDMASLPTVGSWPDAPIEREFLSGMRFRNGDTLFARITPCLENGKTAFVQCLPDDAVGWGSTEYIVMRSKPPIPPEFTYLLARHPEFRQQAIRSMTGTSGRQRAQVEAIATFKMAIPNSDDVWNKFGDFSKSVFQEIKTASEESQTLAILRDALLPKLLSGQLCVKQVNDSSSDSLRTTHRRNNG